MNEKLALCVAIGCATAFAATNYDLLGRNGSKMNSPMVYRNVDYSKMKKDNQQDVGVQRGNKALKKLSSRLYWIDGLEGIFSTSGLSYNGSLLPFYCETSQSNGVHIYGYYSDLAEYLEHPNFYFIPTNLVQNYTPSGIQTSGQATFTNYTLSEPYDASSYAPTTFWTVEFGNIMANRGSIGWWFDNGYGQCQECADVGMYMDIGAFPVRLEPNKTTSYIAYNQGEAMNPDPEREVIASKAYSLLSETTKNTTFFVSNGLPENPESKSPQVYIGLHNRKNDPNVLHEAATYYGEEARALDNYIYENRTVDIVAAGNYWIRNNDAQLNAQAHAANAITVGRLIPIQVELLITRRISPDIAKQVLVIARMRLILQQVPSSPKSTTIPSSLGLETGRGRTLAVGRRIMHLPITMEPRLRRLIRRLRWLHS